MVSIAAVLGLEGFLDTVPIKTPTNGQYNAPQIVDVIAEEEAGWWKGSLGGKVGVFPSNFVEEVNEETPKSEPPKSEPLRTESKPSIVDGVKLPISVAPPPGSENKPPVAEVRHLHEPKDEPDGKPLRLR